MHGQQLRLVGGAGATSAEPVQHAELAGQADGQVQADRVHRVVTEVVGQVALVPDRAGAQSIPRLEGPSRRSPVRGRATRYRRRGADPEYPIRTDRLLLRPLDPAPTSTPCTPTSRARTSAATSPTSRVARRGRAASPTRARASTLDAGQPPDWPCRRPRDRALIGDFMLA